MHEDLEPMAVSADKAAALMDISKPKLYSLMKRDDFPAFKLGGRTLISVDGLRQWINEQATKSTNLRS